MKVEKEEGRGEKSWRRRWQLKKKKEEEEENKENEK